MASESCEGGEGMHVLAWSLGEVSSAREEHCTLSCCFMCSLIEEQTKKYQFIVIIYMRD